MKTLLFYDLETSGLTPFDQVLDYAAIRIDQETWEEVERYEVSLQWRRDIIPSAQAFLVHQIGFSNREGLGEFAAIHKIHQHVNTPGTVSGGYNTLGFDDEMLRFSFYRNLLPVYTHQYANACGRFDVLPLVVFYYLFAPEALVWPKKEDGSVSFKLEDLNAENKWVEGRAHEAMHDVLVTVALARHLRLNRPVWDYLMGYYDKAIDMGRVQDLMKQEGIWQGVGLMVSLRFGFKNQYLVPVLHIGAHHLFKNQAVFIRLDQPIAELTGEALESLIVKKKYAEPGFVLPYLDKYSQRLDAERLSCVEANLAKIRACDNFIEIAHHCRHLHMDFPQHIDVDAALYANGFLSHDEQSWCEKFLLGKKQARSELLQINHNDVLQKQALRFLWRNAPDDIPSHLYHDAERTLKDYLHHAVDYKGHRRNDVDQAEKDINQALSNASDPMIKAGFVDMLEHLKDLRQELSL